MHVLAIDYLLLCFFTAIGRSLSMILCTKVQLLIVLACLPFLLCVRGSIVFDGTDEKLIIVNPLIINEPPDLP